METLVITTASRLDKQALIGMYQEHSDELFRYAFRMLGERAIAEDCVAETFSRLLKAVRQGRGPTQNGRAWLFRVAHNWVTDYYRRKPVQPLSNESDMPVDPDGNPAQELLKKLDRERVMAALMQLPPDQRQVIELRFLEDWRHEQVAEALGKSNEAVRAMQHRALNTLRRALSQGETS